jgi:predicted MFS family arabinose efflux permease
LVISTLGPLTGAVIEGPRQGWSSAVIVALFAVAIVSAMALVLLEPRRREPLIDLRFFRSAPFAGATLIAVVALVANAGFLFLNTLYLQDARGYSPLHAGLLMIPLAGAVAICSNLSGKIITRRGPRLALCLAGLLIAIGNGLMITVSAHTAVWFLVLAYVVFGAGAGLVGAPITNTALSGMPRDQSGVAGAIASTGRQIGSAIGVAVTGSILAGSSAALVHASRPAWAVLAGCGVGTLVLGFASTGRWAQASAQRNGERLAAEAATAR